MEDEVKKISIIRSINNEISYYSNIINDLKYKLKAETLDLKSICKHDYVKNDDGDYHRKSYYYICTKCSNVRSTLN